MAFSFPVWLGSQPGAEPVGNDQSVAANAVPVYEVQSLTGGAIPVRIVAKPTGTPPFPNDPGNDLAAVPVWICPAPLQVADPPTDQSQAAAAQAIFVVTS
jgi:hypothetical protein